MSALHMPRQNQILGALSEGAYDRLLPHLEPVPMPLADVLYENDTELSHVYFPTTSIVSMFQAMANGVSAQIATVGSEGLVGLALFMGSDTTPNRAVVHSGGDGFRIETRFLRAELDRAGSTLHLLLRYTQTLLTQMTQTAACNRHHGVQQQFCRWLLLSLDRSDANTLAIMQETLAGMLGISVAATSAVIEQFKQQRLLRYDGVRIEVLDRGALEALVCECYAALKREVERLSDPTRA